jgi:hypothetical protein
MALRSTQPLTEMSTRNIPGDNRRPARKANNLTAKIWEPRRLKPYGFSQHITGIALLFTFRNE